jgi:hypothetical protein
MLRRWAVCCREGVEVGLVKEHADAAAEDKAGTKLQLIGKAYARAEVIEGSGIERADSASLEDETVDRAGGPGTEDGEVLQFVVHRSEVVVTDAVVDVETRVT